MMHDRQPAASGLSIWIGDLGRLGAGLSALILVVLALLTAADVAGRYLFNHPIPGVAEFTKFAMGAIVYLAMTRVTTTRSHIRFDLVAEHLPAPLRALLALGVDLLGALFWAVLAVFLWIGAMDVYRLGYTTDIGRLPIWPVACILAAGASLTALAAALQAVQGLRQEAQP
jgi:TRAP-type C4-dicarboxylate transport system permease small subunit